MSEYVGGDECDKYLTDKGYRMTGAGAILTCDNVIEYKLNYDILIWNFVYLLTVT